MERKCLDCGEPITGRSDKKFCSDQCRNNYNNKLNSESLYYVRNINSILRKNRRILDYLIAQKKEIVHKDKLTSMGFNFNYFTRIKNMDQNRVCFFCYEQGYFPVNDEFFSLVKYDEEMVS